MRKYFFKDANIEKGPLTLDQLKLEKIYAHTPIWFEEIGEWVTAGELEELEDYLQTRNVNNMFTGLTNSNNFNQQIDITNNYALALSTHKAATRNSMSLSILVYGLLIIAALMILSKS